jgi:DNA-binding transcriptional regulator YdaS (Cro superfamily)
MRYDQQKASPEEALEAAAKAAGNRARLASRLGLTKAAVHRWRQVPALRVLAVEAATGIRRELLRPDIYPAE